MVSLICSIYSGAAASYADRFVWIFGWNLGRESDVPAITSVLETAAAHGLNGAMVSFGLDTLCKKSPDYFRRLEAIRQASERLKIELIPAVFSVGYGGSVLAHDRNLAEGMEVQNALFQVQGSQARFVPDSTVQLANGGFEESRDHRLARFNFHDQPGEISFVDTQVRP